MKVIAFHLQKGGVGKTTMSVTTAYELATSGNRTVLIDADPQGNSSSWLLEGRAEPEYELADILTGDCEVNEALCPVPDVPNLSVVPTLALTNALRNYAKVGLASEPFAVANIVENMDADAVIIDMGPGLGSLETASLIATNEVVLTMSPEYFSLDGLTTWASAVEQIEKGMRVKIHRERLVVNGINRSVGQMVDVTETARKQAKHVYTISTDPVFRKAQAEHLPAQLFVESPMKTENRNMFRQLAKEIMS